LRKLYPYHANRGTSMLRSIFILTAFFVLIASSYSFERQVTAVWDATGDTLALDSVRYTTVSSVSSEEPVDYLNGNTLFNPSAASVDYSIYSYEGRNIEQGSLAPHTQQNLDIDKGVYFIQVDGRVYKWQRDNHNGQTSPRLLSAPDDSVAIAFKTGYKNKPILIQPNQEEIVFQMERDSTLNYHTIKKLTLIMNLDSCIISYANHFHGDTINYIPRKEYYTDSFGFDVYERDFSDTLSPSTFIDNTLYYKSLSSYDKSYGNRQLSFNIGSDKIIDYYYSHVFGYSNALRDSYHYDYNIYIDSLYLYKATKNAFTFQYRIGNSNISYNNMKNDVWNGYYTRSRFDSIINHDAIEVELIFFNR
jgi:hypothetical protein